MKFQDVVVGQISLGNDCRGCSPEEFLRITAATASVIPSQGDDSHGLYAADPFFGLTVEVMQATPPATPLAHEFRVAGISALDPAWVKKFKKEYKEDFCNAQSSADMETYYEWPSYEKAVAYYRRETGWKSVPLANWMTVARRPEVPAEGLALAEEVQQRLPQAEVVVEYFDQDPFLYAVLGGEEIYFYHFGE